MIEDPIWWSASTRPREQDNDKLDQGRCDRWSAMVTYARGEKCATALLTEMDVGKAIPEHGVESARDSGKY